MMEGKAKLWVCLLGALMPNLASITDKLCADYSCDVNWRLRLKSLSRRRDVNESLTEKRLQ